METSYLCNLRNCQPMNFIQSFTSRWWEFIWCFVWNLLYNVMVCMYWVHKLLHVYSKHKTVCVLKYMHILWVVMSWEYACTKKTLSGVHLYCTHTFFSYQQRTHTWTHYICKFFFSFTVAKMATFGLHFVSIYALLAELVAFNNQDLTGRVLFRLRKIFYIVYVKVYCVCQTHNKEEGYARGLLLGGSQYSLVTMHLYLHCEVGSYFFNLF